MVLETPTSSGQHRLSDCLGRTASKALVDGKLRHTRQDDLERSSTLQREDTLLAKLNAKRKQQRNNRLNTAGEIVSPRQRGPSPTAPRASIFSAPRARRPSGKHNRTQLDDGALQVATSNTIDAKEEMLEQIMSAEAHQSFEVMSRYQLNRNVVTRVSMAADRLFPADVDRICNEAIVNSPEEAVFSDSDDELIESYRLQQLVKAPEDTKQRKGMAGRNRNIEEPSGLLPEDYGLMCGYACPLASDIRMADWRNPLDAVFAARCGPYRLLGLVNSHGASDPGYELTRLISEEFSQCLFRSHHLAKNKDPEAALLSTFKRIHATSCQVLDLRLTGASVTALLLDEQDMWIAHVGDCRAVLGKQDTQANAEEYHFCPETLTADHKLAVAQEFDRVAAHGADVRRLVGDSSHRLFVQDSDLPGLALTRSIGEVLAHTVGVTHVPTITRRRLEDLPSGGFIVIGSGAVWATMAERTVVNRVGKNFTSPDEAAEVLSVEALTRWEDPALLSRLCLREDEPDCFSVCVLFLGAKESVRVVPAEGE